MTVRKLIPDRCPDHPESRTHLTRELTSNPLEGSSQHEILQYLCGEEGCPQKLGWVYEGPQGARSGSGACPERLIQIVKAEKHKIDSLFFTLGVAVASGLMLFVLYIAITASSNQLWGLTPLVRNGRQLHNYRPGPPGHSSNSQKRRTQAHGKRMKIKQLTPKRR